MDEKTNGSPAGLDAALDEILNAFQATGRLDHAHERLRQALREALLARGIANGRLKIIEVNLFGSLSGWMEFVLEERAQGRNAVPDFARHLRRAFLAHCRQHDIEPDAAIGMAVELATAIMDLACGFRRHLSLDGEAEDEAPPQESA